MELETINKLYLELSQVTTATTKREFELVEVIERLLDNPQHPLVMSTARGMVNLYKMKHA